MSLSVLCLLANLTPGFYIQDLYMQVKSVDRVLCGPVAPNEVVFHLFTKKNNITNDVLRLDDDESISKSNINFKDPTVIFTHGFMEGVNSTVSQVIKNAFLEIEENYNIILVDAKDLYAGPNYITAANNVQAVGKYIAKFLDYLITRGLNLNTLHVMGMSLGGQTTGIIGSSLKSGKLPRITAFDPAGPLFDGNPENKRLDANDADLVVVVHSNPSLFGYSEKCGDVDFWINGGKDVQPGCSPQETLSRKPDRLSELLFCSHYVSYRVGAYGITHPKAFPAKECPNYEQYLSGSCDNNDVEYIGLDIKPTSKGNYYLNVGTDLHKHYS